MQPVQVNATPKRALLISTAMTLVLLSGCITKDDYTGSVNPAATTNTTATNGVSQDLLNATAKWAKKFQRNPNNVAAGINYGRHLRATNRASEAVNVLRQVSAKHPENRDVLGELGKALAANGDLEAAYRILVLAQQSAAPDWRLMSTQGTVLDQMGRSPEAQKLYQDALKLAPGEPSLLSNYGLSLALGGDLVRAEQMLQTAVQHPRATHRVRQNLALVLGLQGRFEEAEKIAAPTLPASSIANNTNYLKGMLDQPDRWSQLQDNSAQ